MANASSNIGMAPPAKTPARNWMALWSMILGIIGAALWWSMVWGIMGAEPMSCALVAIPLGLVAGILGIIGLLRPGRKAMAITGLAASAFMVALFFGVVQFDTTPRVTAARIVTAKGRIFKLTMALQAFKKDIGRYPTENEEPMALNNKLAGPEGGLWHGPYIAENDTDPWGRCYIYRYPGIIHPDSFDLLSMGPDGEAGTADDIVNP